MIIHDVIQGSEEWFALRRGKFTSSNFSDLFYGKTTATYKKAVLKPVYERLTGKSPDDFKSAYMNRGNELEPLAVEWYERKTFTKVHPGGFVELSDWIGASPDGFIGNNGMLQVKCPAWHTMIGALNGDNSILDEYKIQVQGELMVTGREWSDLMFWHPDLQPVIIRINADKEKHEAIEKELKTAIASAESILEKLTRFKK